VKDMRMQEVSRKTKETEVFVKINLDGQGTYEIDTGEPFFNHMLTLLSTHSLIDITAKVKGDLKHHSIEDLTIVLGEAIRKTLGNSEGINRFGSAAVPMDCSLAFCAIDLVKRPYCKIDLKLRGKQIEGMATEDINHFFETLTTSLMANIHIWIEYGNNDHHKAEAAIKALALSLKTAVAMDPRRKGIPSSKGVI
jgi:imidazoleglycerol-phosphate dehydratase